MSHTEDLLRVFLSTAIPLRIMEFQRVPWVDLQRRAGVAAQHVAEHGDIILFKSKTKGETAKAVNELAVGMAILAFSPGGVKAFGLHFEARHPEVASQPA